MTRDAAAPLAERDLLVAIADGAVGESGLWREALRPEGEQQRHAIFSTLAADTRFALGLETIYEGYLLHYGRSRLFAPADFDIAVLLGDTLLAHGLVRVSAAGDVGAVAQLARLLSLCAQLRAEQRPGDGAAWAATAVMLGKAESGESGAAFTALGEDGGEEAALVFARGSAGTEAVDHALHLHLAQVAAPVL